jgi:SAM-dependent methyltransferase
VVASTVPTCRLCESVLDTTLVDLGVSPPCESYLAAEQLNEMEPFYPLHVWVCSECFLVQLEEYVAAEDIFTEYAYFSSYSTSWVEHARRYVERIVTDLDLTTSSLVIELASNDGYLLQHFAPYGIPVIGIEPAKNVAEVAIDMGIETLTEFFSSDMARRLRDQGREADLIVANNVLAQVPDLNDFVEGIKILLAERGVVTLEFPHLERLIAGNQFDTIYHEHFSYFSLHTSRAVLLRHGLDVFDVEEIPTHGGSLRVYARHQEDNARPESRRVAELLDRELDTGVLEARYYSAFRGRVEQTKRKLLAFLIEAKEAGKSIVGYGAPGKGNTLLNFCGIRQDFLDYTVDRNPYKHGKYLPGSHIPIFDVGKVAETRPDYLLILPWNLKTEIMDQTSYIRQWGGRHVVAIPELQVLT